MRESFKISYTFTYEFHIAPQNSTQNSYADVNFQIRPTLKFHLLPKIYH